MCSYSLYFLKRTEHWNGGFDILTAGVIVWDITPCNPLKIYRHFGRTYRLHLQGQVHLSYSPAQYTHTRHSRHDATRKVVRCGVWWPLRLNARVPPRRVNPRKQAVELIASSVARKEGARGNLLTKTSLTFILVRLLNLWKTYNRLKCRTDLLNNRYFKLHIKKRIWFSE
jgi:hypothetical protein